MAEFGAKDVKALRDATGAGMMDAKRALQENGGDMEAAAKWLREQGITANYLPIRWLVPLHGDAILDLLKDAKHTIIVENNYSGQFARYLRSETGIVADGHIRKYDGEPFMPHHVVDGVKAILSGSTRQYVPVHEIMV